MVLPMGDFSVSGLSLVLARLLPEPHAGLLAGLLFGTKASLSKELYAELIRSGTLHIVALSGMNITIIADLFAKGLLWVVSKRIASLLTILGIIWFVWFVGPSASIVRAAIMGSISLIAIIFGRQYWALLTWGLAVSTMLLLNFAWLFELSFQLSALATLGIILFGNTIERDKKAKMDDRKNAIAFILSSRSIELLRSNLRLTLAAQVFTIPLILFHFHRISLISPIANLAIGWLISPLTVIGWITAVAGWLWLPLGQVVAWVGWVLLEYLVLVVRLTAAIPLASLGW